MMRSIYVRIFDEKSYSDQVKSCLISVKSNSIIVKIKIALT